MTAAKKPAKRAAKSKTKSKAQLERERQKRADYAREYYHRRKEREKAQSNGNGAVPDDLSKMAITHGISRFLDGCRARTPSGRRARRGVSLGALPGFPQFTDDPEVIERAVEAILARAAEAKTVVVELELRQRARDLAAAAIELLEGGSDDDRNIFVAYGAAWAASRKYPISYETFRDMGVPADALRDAGISRS